MRFAKKISILGLISIMASTASLSTVSADTNSNNTSNLEVSVNARGLISKEEAKNIMLKKVPNGKIVEFSYEYDDGIHKYEGKVIKDRYEYEIVVNATTGAILEFEKDIRDDDDIYDEDFENSSSNTNNKLIGENKARTIMLNKVPGGKIIFIELDYDDDTPEYEGKVVKGTREYEISVNGYNGKIVEFEAENRYDYSNSSSGSNVHENLIGETKAKQIMLNKVPGAKITKFALDLDDRIPEYKGELVKGYREYEISVHATNGNIIDFSSEMFDDALGHWAEDTIFDFYNRGYINGYADNSFKPDGKITRAEFVKILNNYFNLTKTSGVVFKDTKNHWAKSEIDIAVTNGICQGTSVNEFSPDKPITREEASVMIANYLGIKDKKHDKISKFKDKYNVSSWAKDSVEALLEGGYLTGTSPSTISPKNNTTRSESVTLLSRIDNN